MATFGDLKAAVASDLRRSDLTSEIAQEILDAIDHLGSERFWFNETRSYTFDTVASTSDYTLAAVPPVAEFITIDYLETLANGVYRFIDRVSGDRMADLAQTNANIGVPVAWAYFADGLQLYPSPDTIYTVRIAGHFRFAALSADSDENPWTNAAKTIVRRRAVRKLNERIIRNPDVAMAAATDEMEELARLRAETSRRTATGRIRATVW